MSMEILVTTTDSKPENLSLPDERQVFDYLGDSDEQIVPSVRVKEIVDKVFDEIKESVDFECSVELELSGSLTLTGSGEAKYLFFNVGGGVETVTSMSVKINTKLSSEKIK